MANAKKENRKEENKKRFTNYDLVMSYTPRGFACCFAGFHVSMLRDYAKELGVPLLNDMEGYSISAIDGFEKMFTEKEPTTGLCMLDVVHKMSKESFADFFIDAQLKQAGIFFRRVCGVSIKITNKIKTTSTAGFLQWLNLPARII